MLIYDYHWVLSGFSGRLSKLVYWGDNVPSAYSLEKHLQNSSLFLFEWFYIYISIYNERISGICLAAEEYTLQI